MQALCKMHMEKQIWKIAVTDTSFSTFIFNAKLAPWLIWTGVKKHKGRDISELDDFA